jgi:hypothetical protein
MILTRILIYAILKENTKGGKYAREERIVRERQVQASEDHF